MWSQIHSSYYQRLNVRDDCLFFVFLQGWVKEQEGETVYAENVGGPESVDTYSRTTVHTNRLVRPLKQKNAKKSYKDPTCPQKEHNKEREREHIHVVSPSNACV